jgi:GDP-L-fucose synthase
LFGPGDNFDLQNSHVLPALIRKFHEAKIKGSKEMVAWGTGKPRREFLYVDDVADACVFLMNNFDPTKEQNENGEMFINIGRGEDLKIFKLAELIGGIVGYKGKIVWDKNQPDGMAQKLLDVSLVKKLGWRHKIDLEEGIKSTYEWFKKNY